jgi:hypothetical protein
MLEFLRQQLKELLEARAALKSELDGILVAPTNEKRGLTEAEDKTFAEKRDAITAKDGEIQAVQKRIAELEEIEQRSENANKLAAEFGQKGEQRKPSVQVGAEPFTYNRWNRNHSYFLDLARVELRRGDGDGGVEEARARLLRHANELDVEMPKRQQLREQRAVDDLGKIDDLKAEQRASVFERQEKRAAPNRVDGQGGYFVPPLWLIDEYIDLARFGRQTANLCRNSPLPTGTD